MSIDITQLVHWVIIKVYTKQGGDLVEFLKWDGLPWEVRIKWNWYFRYRECLLQVKYPKYFVEIKWGNREADSKDEVKRIIKNKIKNRKAKITEIERKLDLARKHWDEIFPIENDSLFKKAVAKLERKKQELEELLKL